MKHFLISILFALATIISAPSSHAQYYSGQTVNVQYPNTPVGQGSWTVIIAQSTRSISSMSVLNTGANSIYIGFAGVGAHLNAETTVATIPAGMSAALWLPIKFSGGYRISIIGAGTVNTGYGSFNFFY